MFPGWKRCFLPSTLPDVPIKGFIETSFIDWKSELASVLFTGGCNFRCPFCHNRDLVLRPEALEDVPLDYILARLRKFRNWIGHVVITGGEPTMHRDIAGLIAVLKERGLKVKLDTNGSRPEVLRALVEAGLIDYIAMDVMGPVDAYERWCGVGVDAGKIRESIDFIRQGRIDYEFRMTLVPFLHQEEDAYRAAREIAPARRFFVQDFIPRDTLNKKYATIRPFSAEKMNLIREKAERIIEHAPVRRSLH